MPSLDDRLGQFPEPWRPSPGDRIIGELTELDTRASDYGEPYEILTILTDSGEEYSVHAFHTMLRNQVAQKRPQLGDRVGIAYFGPADKPSAEGLAPAERYRMIVERAGNQQPPASAAAVDDPLPEPEPPSTEDSKPDDSIPF